VLCKPASLLLPLVVHVSHACMLSLSLHFIVHVLFCMLSFGCANMSVLALVGIYVGLGIYVWSSGVCTTVRCRCGSAQVLCGWVVAGCQGWPEGDWIYADWDGVLVSRGSSADIDHSQLFCHCIALWMFSFSLMRPRDPVYV